MSGKPVLTGDLNSVSLADVISMLNLSRKTGVLRCTRGADTRSVFWEQGEIVFARSNSVRDNLGCFLVRRGLINEEQNAESARRIAASADAVVIGSRLIQEIEAGSADQAVARVKAFLQPIRQALDASFHR